MKVVTTHMAADFDAFACAVVSARKLFPDHNVVFPGSLEAAVRRFLAENTIPFPESKLKELRRSKIEHAVVVDTCDPARLGEAWPLIAQSGCPITLIDHHVPCRGGIRAHTKHVQKVGATSTILTNLLRRQKIYPDRLEATLLLMGIYEDTGGLSYPDTTPRDLRAAAWLLSQGADLTWVTRWVSKWLYPEQLQLLNSLVFSAKLFSRAGIRVAVSAVEVEHFVEEAAQAVQKWMDTFELDAAAALLYMRGITKVILRSRTSKVNVGEIARELGGGGHATAAAARTEKASLVEASEQVTRLLLSKLPPSPTAGELAGKTVFWLSTETTVAEAKETLNRLRVNALPVRNNAGEPVGTITRQILDAAISHGLGSRPVSDVMSRDVLVVDQNQPIESLVDMFLEGSKRFALVRLKENSYGIITRTELLRSAFTLEWETGRTLENKMAGRKPTTQNIARLMRERLATWTLNLLEEAANVSRSTQIPAYLVGGAVRDLLLGHSVEDIDLVVEGDGIAFAKELAAKVGARVNSHPPFMTATLTLPNGERVDVASARTEFYRAPAALPEVQTSLLRQDLYRRDFTINALAVALGPYEWGKLIDFFGGRRDLANRQIRVLHSLSFIDDPTRAIRAVRYATKLQFTIASDTLHLMQVALKEGVFDKLSPARLRAEIKRLLETAPPCTALEKMAELGLLKAALNLPWDEESAQRCRAAADALAWFQLMGLKWKEPPQPWEYFLLAVALKSGAGNITLLARRLGIAGRRLRAWKTAAEGSIRVAKAACKSLGELADTLEETGALAGLLAMSTASSEARRSIAQGLETVARWKSPVSGKNLLDSGIKPGPAIGIALKKLRRAILDGDPEATADPLRYALKAAQEAIESKRD